MFLWIIALVIVLIGATIGAFIGFDIWDRIQLALSGAFFAALIAVVVLFVGSIIAYEAADTETRVRGETSIVAIADSSELQGTYFLFAGTVDEKQRYYYYRQSDDGGISQGSVSVDKATIYEDAVDEAYIVTYETCTVPNRWTVMHDCGNRTFDIHVPPGTVLRNFELDLNK